MIATTFDFEGLRHFFTSLERLTSFDHARCDAILQQRNIAIAGAYAPAKGSMERDTVWVGFAYLVFWCTLVTLLLQNSWLPENRYSRVGEARYLTPIFICGALLGLALQLHAMADYADVCSKLLAGKPVPAAFRAGVPQRSVPRVEQSAMRLHLSIIPMYERAAPVHA